MSRIAISKRVRFEVFKRDAFTCQYCGATPPKVILHLDHIHPVSLGGANDGDNLVTSCQACNLGKSDVPLSSVPKTLEDRAVEVAEREEQIRGYNEVLRARAERIEDECWQVARILERDPELRSYGRADLLSIKRFIERLPLQDVLDAAEVTNANWPQSGGRHFRYFCGVCWNKIREQENG